jgi:hypothetical protein
VATGRQIKLYLAEGTPGGLTTAEIMNWTGHVVAASRSDLAQLLKRDEPKRTGVYVLLGEATDSVVVVNTRAVYVGEGDDISRRLRQHAKSEEQGGKDFWDRVLIFTSKDANLTKAHARYLEARLLEVAQAAGRAQVTNTQTPEPALLPEADISDMEYYLSQVLTVLPVLGVHDFRKPASLTSLQTGTALTPALAEDAVSPVFRFRLVKYGIEARAQEADGEFTVLSGSGARSSWNREDEKAGYRGLYDRLFDEGSLVFSSDGSKASFTRDVAFNSPSAAAAVVAGRAANGRKSWRSETTGETFGEWQNRGVDSLPTE